MHLHAEALFNKQFDSQDQNNCNDVVKLKRYFTFIYPATDLMQN